jgi:hypothetical protein
MSYIYLTTDFLKEQPNNKTQSYRMRPIRLCKNSANVPFICLRASVDVYAIRRVHLPKSVSMVASFT